ncbi:PREDICTED: target of Myb protein 1 [Theobroma cacao]|uniref:Target of Myb protein 1 n=1 Tax=Theobroma cacao TaxID=3641 RepID=A0AB32W9Z9_THECC|nr:PREDICTED: target of Myb protein 1 [Theobroma cacao]
MMMMSSASSSAATVAVDKATSDLLIGPDWTMNIDICDSVNSNHWQAKDVVKAVKKRLQHKSSKVQLLALTLLETMVKNCGDYVHFQIAERNILGEMVKIVKKKADMVVRDKILVLLDSWQEAFGGPGGKHPHYYWAYDELRRSGVEFPKRSLDAAPIFTPPATHPTVRHNHPGYGMPSNSSRRLDETMATEIESLSLSSLDSMRDVMELLSDMLQAVNPDDRAAVKDEVIVDLVNRCRSNQKKLMQMLTTTGDEELLARGLELNDSLQSLLAKHDAIASGSPLPIQVTNVSSKPAEASTSNKSNEVKDSSLTPNISPSAPIATVTRSQIDEEEEEEDDFAQLARRHSRAQSTSSQSTSAGTSEGIVPINNTAPTTSYVPAASTSTPCNALALPDPPAPVRTTKEQDLIDLLSITLSTTSASSPHTPPTPSASYQNMHQAPVPPSTQGYPYASQTYPGSQRQLPYNSYVVPWAQPQPHPQKPSQPQVQPQYLSQQQVHPQSQHQIDQQSQSQSQFHTDSQTQIQSNSLSQAQPHFQTQSQSLPRPQSHPLQLQAASQIQLQPQSQSQPQRQAQQQTQPRLQAQSQTQTQSFLQPQHQPQSQSQPQRQAQQQTQPRLQAQSQTQTQSFLQPQHQPHFQPQYPQYSSGYPPPPWAAIPGYFNSQNHLSSANNMFSTPQMNIATSNPVIGNRPLQHVNSFPARGSNGAPMNGDSWASTGYKNPTPVAGQKPFIPSYRLFEDLNVLGNTDGRLKMTSSTSPSLSGTSSQSMVGGRK